MYFLWFKNEDTGAVLSVAGATEDYRDDHNACVALPDASVVGFAIKKVQGGPGQAFQRVELLELENGLVIEHEAWQQTGGVVTANTIVHKT